MILKYVKVLLLLLVLSIVGDSKLYQVVSMFRHGARYHMNSDYDGNATRPLWGQLTAVGMRQHQNFGKILRKQYIDTLKFLSPNFNSTQIEIFSTHTNRTIQSAMSHMYGLYPPGTGPRLTYVDRSYHIPPYSNKSDIEEQNYPFPYAHQPIVIKFNSKIILERCDNQYKEADKIIAAKKGQYDNMVITYTPFLNKMADLFKINRTDFNLSRLTSFYTNLVVDQYLGRPLPKQLSDVDYKNMKHLDYWINSFIFSMNYSKLRNTYKFQKIMDVFDSRVRNPKLYPLKWTVLSAHDGDIFPAQTDLNISSSVCIQELYRSGKTSALNCQGGADFASNIIFQLHSDDEIIFYVKIRFNGKYINLCQKKDQKCSYSQWKARIKRLMISDVEGYCGNKIQTNQNKIQTNQNQFEILDQ